MSYLEKSFGSWYKPLKPILDREYFTEIGKKVNWLYKNKEICPKKEDIFRAFRLCPFSKCSTVIIAQDPFHDYITDNTPRATGLAFSNHKDTIKLSPSLRIIHGELENDLKRLILDFDCTLENWAKQGVLLLNTALTVEKGNPNSHKNLWEPFTKDIIEFLDKEVDPVWVLLGKQAQSYEELLTGVIAEPKIVEAAHPAAELYGHKGFYGSSIFTKVNSMLYMLNKKEIEWVN